MIVFSFCGRTRSRARVRVLTLQGVLVDDFIVVVCIYLRLEL